MSNCNCDNVGLINNDWLCLECGEKAESPKKESKCDHCRDSEDHEYHYWNENICEIEEDYIMPDEYGCVCYRCFEQLKQQGKIKFKIL